MAAHGDAHDGEPACAHGDVLVYAHDGALVPVCEHDASEPEQACDDASELEQACERDASEPELPYVLCEPDVRRHGCFLLRFAYFAVRESGCLFALLHSFRMRR